MKRMLLTAAALLVPLVSTAACSGNSGDSANSGRDGAAPAGGGVPTARPTAGRPTETGSTPGDDGATVSPATRWMLTHQRSLGRNAPGSQGPLLVSERSGRSMFVWETADDRICHGVTSNRSMSLPACNSQPGPAVGRVPRLRTMATTDATSWNVVFGAEHETVQSVTCNSRPVTVHNIGTMTGGERIVYAIEFPGITVGSVTVHVARPDGPATEHISLVATSAPDAHPACR